MDDRHELNLRWLLTLRWWAIVCQALLVLAAAYWLALLERPGSLLVLIAFGATSNAAASHFRPWLRGRLAKVAVAVLMGSDVLLLTALLWLSGGPQNPFSFLYLVNIALGAVVLPQAWTWVLAAVSIACFGGLFLAEPQGLRPLSEHSDHFRVHMQGMWLAMVCTAVFIAYFVTRVTRELSVQDAQLRKARESAQRSERVASLARMAAGAAHELATPLSTIAVVSRELQRLLEGAQEEDAAADAATIRKQVDRCQHILSQMAAQAGQTVGESPRQTSLATLAQQALESLPPAAQQAIRLDVPAGAQSVHVPANALVQSVSALLSNALDASGDQAAVELCLAVEGPRLTIRVTDEGVGMDASTLERATEPFFTQKAPGRGMGLGLFVVRELCENLGGEFRLRSHRGRGTVATMSIPVGSGGSGASHLPESLPVAQGLV